MKSGIPEACLWHEPEVPQSIPDDLNNNSCDVIIIGAGFTGLWTALYLQETAPQLDIRVLEKHHVGFGASGRNGGWASALLPMSVGSLVKKYGSESTRRTFATMNDSVDEIVKRARDWQVGDSLSKGGWIQVATTDVQCRRLDEQFRELELLGIPEATGTRLNEEEARSLVAAKGCLGGVFNANCAAINPGVLVRALASEVRRLGVRIHEGTNVMTIEPNEVSTERGRLRAPVILRATEAFTPTFSGRKREVVPLYSMMIATEPLPKALIDSLIDPTRPTFNDARHMIIYGQRTADDRIAFGGRGAPYHFGSRVRPQFDHDQRVASMLAVTLRELFPELIDHRITHHWGGPLGAPRDWHCSVAFDASTGIGHAGGYVGDGVTTANASGRALADLALGRESVFTELPWVSHRSRRWEPEPVRWMAINALTRLASLADARESSTRKRAVWLERALDRVLGH